MYPSIPLARLFTFASVRTGVCNDDVPATVATVMDSVVTVV